MTYEYQLISAAVRCQVHNCTTAKAQWIPLLENVADLAPNGLCLALCGEKESTSAVELPFPDWFHWKPQWIAVGLHVVLSVFLNPLPSNRHDFMNAPNCHSGYPFMPR